LLDVGFDGRSVLLKILDATPKPRCLGLILQVQLHQNMAFERKDYTKIRRTCKKGTIDTIDASMNWHTKR